jgi:hypothetical protein
MRKREECRRSPHESQSRQLWRIYVFQAQHTAQRLNGLVMGWSQRFVTDQFAAAFGPVSWSGTSGLHYRNLKHCQYGAMRIRFYDTVSLLFTNSAIWLCVAYAFLFFKKALDWQTPGG